jgi:endonuclease G
VIKSVEIFIILLFVVTVAYSQDNSDLLRLQKESKKLELLQDSIDKQIELLKLKDLKTRIISEDLPTVNEGEELICHKAFCLVYSEDNEVAKWVAHIISHDIVDGAVSRTNDFRVDSLISTGSSEEIDYFIKTKKDDGSYDYDGFGYDRGHLAPSADFRWSEIALSESYFYSNMTPQLPEFNREIWADIEGFLRAHIYNNPTKDLYVVTGPVLNDNLPKQERSKNQVSIPKYYFKVAVDYEENKGIAFLISQEKTDYPIESYVVTIDSVESITGIDFYPNLSEDQEKKIESSSDISDWRTGSAKKDVAPFTQKELSRNCYNTIQAKQFYDYPKEVKICGTVVSTHKSGKGHIFLNLDKGFPNQVFSATIWKSNIVNFSYEPEVFLIDKRVCIEGIVKDYQGTPSMYPSNDKKIEIL